MATGRQIAETVARCVDHVVFCRNSGETRRAKDLMAAEARAITGLAKTSDEAGRILAGVSTGLVARYGPEDGARLSAAFARAFGSNPPFLPVPSLSGAWREPERAALHPPRNRSTRRPIPGGGRDHYRDGGEA